MILNAVFLSGCKYINYFYSNKKKIIYFIYFLNQQKLNLLPIKFRTAKIQRFLIKNLI
jgi:hypothetical protein